MKADHRNVTLSLPEPLLRRFRVYAAERNQSMTALMTDAIRHMVDQDSVDQEKEAERIKAGKRLIARMRNAPAGRLPGGKITWTRDELWEQILDPQVKGK